MYENLLHKLIDSRNEKLWREIDSKYLVDFNYSTKREYGCFSKNDRVVFTIDSKNICKASFTHEMLHVYLRLKECFVGGCFKIHVMEDNYLSKLYSDTLVDHIGNSLDHIKMLPIYLDMGFKKELFITDFTLQKMDKKNLNRLAKKYHVRGKVNIEAFNYYVGKLIAIYADPNEKHDYGGILCEMEKIDPLLFQITTDFISKWEKYEFEKQDDIVNCSVTYHRVLYTQVS